MQYAYTHAATVLVLHVACTLQEMIPSETSAILTIVLPHAPNALFVVAHPRDHEEWQCLHLQDRCCSNRSLLRLLSSLPITLQVLHVMQKVGQHAELVTDMCHSAGQL